MCRHPGASRQWWQSRGQSVVMRGSLDQLKCALTKTRVRFIRFERFTAVLGYFFLVPWCCFLQPACSVLLGNGCSLHFGALRVVLSAHALRTSCYRCRLGEQRGTCSPLASCSPAVDGAFKLLTRVQTRRSAALAGSQDKRLSFTTKLCFLSMRTSALSIR